MTQDANTHRQEVRLSFTADISNSPIVCLLVTKYNLIFNILKAQISPRKEGKLTLELIGKKEDIQNGIAYLKAEGVKVLGVAQKVCRDETLCIHCGFCTALCPTTALQVDVTTRLVEFTVSECVSCGLCTKTCPLNAMKKDVQEVLM